MTYFLVFTCFWVEQWTSADMVTFKKPVLLWRSENMISLNKAESQTEFVVGVRVFFKRESLVVVINHCLSTVVSKLYIFKHKCSHLSILGTIFFFYFVLSHSKAVPNHFYIPHPFKIFDMFLHPSHNMRL